MKVTYRDISEAGSLVQVYNEQVAGTPHCYAVTPEEFQEGLHYRWRYDKPYDALDSEKIIVAEEVGRAVGFAHVAMGEVKIDDEKKSGGIIRFLTYQTGNRSTGQRLLEECEKYLSRLGADRVLAFNINYGYRFHQLGFGYVSERMGHIQGLLGMNGYEIENGEIFMEQPECIVTEPRPPEKQVEIVVERKPGRGVLPGLTVLAFRDGEEIGICKSLSAGEFYRAKEAQDWLFTKWLGVEEPEQGKGLGRYLLHRARWEMRKIGYKNALISTNVKNYRALLFYTNYGYSVFDIAYGFSRSLSDD